MLQDLPRTLKPEGMVAPPIKAPVPYLRGGGVASDVSIEVGTGHGPPWRCRSFPQAQFVRVDPQAASAERAREKGHADNVHVHVAALDAHEGQATVPHSDQGKQTATARPRRGTDPLAKRFTQTDRHWVPVRRLDDIALAYPGCVGLKIDTEGRAPEVRRGAGNTLKRCDFAIVKLSLAQRFAGLGMPSSAIALLAQAGLIKTGSQWREVLHIGTRAGKHARSRDMDVLFTRWVS